MIIRLKQNMATLWQRTITIAAAPRLVSHERYASTAVRTRQLHGVDMLPTRRMSRPVSVWRGVSPVDAAHSQYFSTQNFSNDSNHKWRRIAPISTKAEQETYERNETPKAIVVLLGWWGSKPQHLDKYARALWQQILPKATIIAGTARNEALTLKNDDELYDFASQGLEELSEALKESGNASTPIILHVFSNGGAFVWQHMLRQFNEAEAIKKLHGNETDEKEVLSEAMNYQTNLLALRRNIRGLIFDSAPAYPSVKSGLTALEESGVTTGTLPKPVIKLAFALGYFWTIAWERFQGRPNRYLQYWDELKDCKWLLPQAYIFSEADAMVDPRWLESLIQYREAMMRQDGGISVLKFEDSPHVAHFRQYPEEYKSFVAKIANQWIHQGSCHLGC